MSEQMNLFSFDTESNDFDIKTADSKAIIEYIAPRVDIQFDYDPAMEQYVAKIGKNTMIIKKSFLSGLPVIKYAFNGPEIDSWGYGTGVDNIIEFIKKDLKRLRK